ncbi:ABC transporter ATP-binding protein [Rhodococcus rhodochrous]|uniref:ABC transporter ATP-binding protein n=1 Tax=Rhodococcus rhodochrous TaxID=1829 RepID=A0AAW4XEC8_RHORH|nr:ABC transporter ATP-binding protein [Rhodococcus rhodochrous]MCD2111312.1 ABC transporter ATP-binding protein [Rhodococcus rhodochrous]QOH54682.1 ABC transporter [Rhodococcus rhodochrous]
MIELETRIDPNGHRDIALEAINLTKSYGGGETRKLILEPTSLVLHENELVSIVGPSGCGKSTLLMMVAGLLAPTDGSVLVNDKEIDGPPMGLAVVFQDYSRSLFPWMTVRKNLRAATYAYGLSRAETDDRIDHALKAVGLPGAADMYPWQMSGGMQQRVAIARALVVEPKVMLMDEPFAAVDAQTRADLEDLVLQLRDEYGMAVAFVTHDIDEAVYIGDRVVVLAANPGRIVADIVVDLPSERDQVETKQLARFAELRSEVFRMVMRPRTDG